MKINKQQIDEKHSELLINYLRYLRETDITGIKKRYEAELYINYFGERGYIDIIVESIDNLTFYEIKPDIEDTGATIRQIKKYGELLISKYPNKSVCGCLVLANTTNNLNNIIDYKEYYNASFSNNKLCDYKIIFFNPEFNLQNVLLFNEDIFTFNIYIVDFFKQSKDWVSFCEPNPNTIEKYI